jgi:hypothetical protein
MAVIVVSRLRQRLTSTIEPVFLNDVVESMNKIEIFHTSHCKGIVESKAIVGFIYEPIRKRRLRSAQPRVAVIDMVSKPRVEASLVDCWRGEAPPRTATCTKHRLLA